jgi:hypothetical protein
MSKKLLKKLVDKEEKLMDTIYEIQEILDAIEDSELSSMADTFVETVLDFLSENDTMTLNEIKRYIDEDLEN